MLLLAALAAYVLSQRIQISDKTSLGMELRRRELLQAQEDEAFSPQAGETERASIKMMREAADRDRLGALARGGGGGRVRGVDYSSVF